MMRRIRVSVDVVWSLNWLWFSNHVYQQGDYRPSAPEYARGWWDYTRPRDTSPEAGLAEWRCWRHALWAQLTRRSSSPETELAGCDPPGFGTLAHAPTLAAQFPRDWDAFRDWWFAAEPDLAASLKTPEVATALAQADRMMPEGHAFTMFVVGLRAAQTLDEAHEHPHGVHHAVISVGMFDESQRFADWLHPTVAEIACHNR